MTTYSSIATNMWPPPSSDTASRLQRLQELENMRKQRQIQSGMTSASEPSDSGTRLSRRQQISGSIGLHRLTASHEEKRKSFQGRRALAEGRTSSLSGSYRSLPNNNEHGGARPKNFEVLSLRRNVSSHEDGINRERSTSLTSSSEDIATPLLRSKSVTGIPVSQSEKLGQPAMEVEKGTYSVAQTSDSQRNTSISEDEEDIESFKRSLFGKQSLVHVPEKEELMLTQGLSVFTDPITTTNREIDTSKLVIHREEPKVEKQYSKSFSDFSGQQRLNNMVSESMTRLDKLFDQPTSKFESVTQNPRITRSDRFEQQHIVSREPHDRNFSREKLVLNVHSRSKGQTELIKGTDAKSSGATSHTVSENQVDLPKQSESTVYPISNEQIDVKEVTSQIVSENAAENIILENQSSAFINKANLTKSQFELPLDNQNSLVEGTKQSVEIQSSVKGIDSSTEYVSKGEQNDQEHIQTDSVTESSNLLSYPTHMKKEDEEDLVDASNVAFFEMDSNDSNQYIQNIAGDSTNFSLFMSSKDFLDYDNANREVSYNNNLTSNEVPSDRFLSSEHQTADYKSLLRKSNYSRQSSDTVTSMLYGNSGETSTSASRYQTLPYTHKEPSDYSLFTSSLDTQNSSVGTIGVSRDAFSRIDDLFDQPKKENTLLTNIQTSTLPRKRSRDSLVGSRPTITRSRSDASDSSYDNRRTLLGRSLRNFQANEEEVEGRQPLFRSSIASYQNKSEESLTSITTRFGALRNRLGISSGLRSNGASENSEHSDNTYNYTRSRSIDYSYDNDRSRNEHEMTRSYDVSSGYQSYDNSYDLTRSKQQTAQPYEITSGYLSRLGNKDISAEITRLTGEISSEFLNKEGSENIDSNKTLTPDSENDIVSPILNQDENFTVLYTEEPLPCQNEIEMSETTFDVEVNFSSSCEVEVGKTLVFSNEDIDNHTIENVVKDNETSIAEVNDQNNTDMTSEQTEVTTNKVDFDKTRNQDAVGTDKDKVSSDDIDGKSTTSSNSSKKKKNKKKGKKGNTADSSKVLVSHPSELLKKNKKSLSKESLNNSKSGDRKDVISPKKSKDKAETLAKKSVKDNSKTKGKEQTSPSTGKDGSDIKSDKSSESSKGKSKVKNLFDTLLHALDRKSDTSSSINLSQEDKSQSSGEKTPVTDEWEIIPAPSSGSSDSKIVLDDNYATFENEDIIAVTKRKSSDDYGGVSTDYYETASDHTISGTSECEEFYEALPTELLGDYWNENDIHTETERKEHFVYVCASSKVKRKRILSDSKNMENINRWIDNNLYPGKKYPNQGEKVANKKFAENSAMSKNDLPPTDFKTRNKSESNNIIKSNVHPDDHKGENNLAQSKTICEDDWNNCDTIIHLQAKVETAKETDTENMKNNKAKEIKQEQTIQNETSVNGLGQLRGQSDIDSGLEKLIENGHLDLNASDRAFADKLVFKLHQKLCSSCQGVLVDVLKETYFERYEELVHVNLRNDSNTVASSLDKDKSSKVDNCETKINATDTKKAQKPKRLELEDLLYGSSKASRTTETSNNVNHQDKTNDPAYIEVQQNIPSSPQKSRKDKPIIIAKNDNFLGSPNGKVSSPNDGEVRIKGKIVTLHKSKKESIVSQKPQPRLCRRKSVEAQKENAKSDNEEEYKLPNLRDNPFIRGDKLRASKGKSDSNLKASATKSPHARRSMSFQSGEKHKSPSRQKSVERSRCVRDSKSPVRQKSVEGGGLMRDSKSPSRQKSVERHGSFKGSNNTKKESVVDRTNSGLQNGKSNLIKSVDSDSYNNKSVSNGKKTPPMSPKRPSIFEQLSLAKTACESIGINSDTDKISDQDSESKTLKAPPRKKKLSAPFRGKKK